MTDRLIKTEANVRISPKIEVLLGAVCQSIHNLNEALDEACYLEAFRYGDQANFHQQDPRMPDVTLGELLSWINNFACVEGPNLAQTQPAGAALLKGRARQLAAMLKPLQAYVAEIANSPAYRGEVPFVFCTLAHPKVYWAFEELCTRLDVLAR